MKELYRIDKRIAFCRLLESYRVAAKSINLNDIDKYLDAKTDVINAYMELIDKVIKLEDEINEFNQQLEIQYV